jgi:hypothetical protein
MPTSESAKFEKRVRKFFTEKFGKFESKKNSKIKIKGVKKNFDLVSVDRNYIGDAKFYKNIKTPAAKWSTIAEYVWLLEKTRARHKFIVFGQDKEVPIRWLKRFGSLTKINFYFFGNNKLKKLN